MAEQPNQPQETVEIITSAYEACGKDINEVRKVPYFDGQRIEETLHGHDRAMREVDPAAQHQALAENYGRLRQSFAFHMGAIGLEPKERKSKLEDCIRKGMDVLSEKYETGRKG